MHKLLLGASALAFGLALSGAAMATGNIDQSNGSGSSGGGSNTANNNAAASDGSNAASNGSTANRTDSHNETTIVPIATDGGQLGVNNVKDGGQNGLQNAKDDGRNLNNVGNNSHNETTTTTTAAGNNAVSGDGSVGGNGNAASGDNSVGGNKTNVEVSIEASDGGQVAGHDAVRSDSHNTSLAFSGPLNIQTLSSEVTDIDYDNSSTAGTVSGGITQNGGSNDSFAGIQTTVTNTGQFNGNQAATAVGADGNISFGGTSTTTNNTGGVGGAGGSGAPGGTGGGVTK